MKDTIRTSEEHKHEYKSGKTTRETAIVDETVSQYTSDRTLELPYDLDSAVVGGA